MMPGDRALTTEPQSMDIRARLLRSFPRWSPSPPAVVSRGSREVALVYSAGVFSRVDGLLYKVQRKEKSPPWVTVYSGGKSSTTINNLAPGYPHRFRLKVIIRASAVKAIKDDDDELIESIERAEFEIGEKGEENEEEKRKDVRHPWLESLWSEEVWTSTDSEGTSSACFCMAVRCGYLMQVQQMLEERPELISVVNNSSGLTPLATAARRGDTGMVGVLVCRGAALEQASAGGRSALQLAAAHARLPVLEMLLASGADASHKDVNGMRLEHFAVDSGDLATVRWVLARGDVRVVDSNGWTPLFRAVVQGASTEIVKELLARGSDVAVTDRRGLTLVAAARLLRGRLGKSRDSILKLVNSQYQHEKARANFTRVTKKLATVHSLLAKK